MYEIYYFLRPLLPQIASLPSPDPLSHIELWKVWRVGSDNSEKKKVKWKIKEKENGKNVLI